MMMIKNRQKTQVRIFYGPAVFFLILLINLVACRQEAKWPGLAVNAEFSERELTDYLVTKLKLKFITTSDFKAPDQAWKFIAEADHENRLVFREEFVVQPSPETWLPGHVYESEKYAFIPAFIDKFKPEFNRGARLSFQVYAENGKKEKISLYQRNLKLKPYPMEIPDVLYLDGWEKAGPSGPTDRFGQTELWTTERATCLIRNPGKSSRLMIRGESLASQTDRQNLLIYLEDRLLDVLQLERGLFQKVYELSPEDLGKNREIKLSLAVDQTFPLESRDGEKESGRRVGVKINTIYLRAK